MGINLESEMNAIKLQEVSLKEERKVETNKVPLVPIHLIKSVDTEDA